MSWNQNKINNHIKAAKLLDKIKDEAFDYIGDKSGIVTEYEVQQFILKQFKQNNLKTDKILPIVAFGENTSFVHYHPSQYSKKIEPETLIMIDIWAGLNKKDAPFADITWMAYKGKRVPDKIKEIFNIVIKARDKAINFIEISLKNKIMPTGREIDKTARDIIKDTGYGDMFLHSIGHSLGFSQPHGRGGRIWKSDRSILKNVGYTIEPGIYIKDQFGARSEIDFYINSDTKLIITSSVQKNILTI